MQRYNPKAIEPKWQKTWEETNIYQADDASVKPKKYILEYFPYPSGAAMHVGHVRNYAIGDAISRFARMRGYNVLHPMGWDAFGLPAENYAIKTGISPRQAIDQNTGRFKQQLTQMGFGYDWSREIDSTDPNYYKWTQWFFLLLYKKGLAYRQESLQWWCPVDKTVLANEQVEAGHCWRCGSEVEKKALKQWFFKITAYADRLEKDLDDVNWTDSIKNMQRNWIGRSKGAEIEFAIEDSDKKVAVFTTRPDTLFGTTFLVLAPEHPMVQEIATPEQRQQVENYQQKTRNKSDIERQETNREKTGVFTGAYAINPMNGQKMPVWIADYVLLGYGTGAIMAVPAHDERDNDFARKFDLPIKAVIAPLGVQIPNIVIEGVEEEAARVAEKVIERKKQIESGEHVYSFEGRLTNSGKYNGLPSSEAREQIVADLTVSGQGKERVNYKMRDWLISRQRYWGAPIPIMYCDACKQRIESEAQAINFYHQGIWQQIISGAKTVESRADNPEEPDRRFADIQAGQYLIFVNKRTSETRYAKVAKAHYFTNLAELFEDKNTLSAIFGGAPPATLEALETSYTNLADGYAEKIRTHGLVCWAFTLVNPGEVPVPENQLPVELPKMDSFEPSGDGRSPLARDPRFVHTTCPDCGGKAERETDTMDGFACSSWYFLRYADPHNPQAAFDPAKAKYWLPVDDYIGGAEHAVMHLLYARFWTKVMFDEGLITFQEPFTTLRNQGMILAPDGQKMSKSKGNTIQPDELIDQGYGADSIRIMELFIGPWNQSANWSVEGMGGSFRFLQRIWTITQEVIEKADLSAQTDIADATALKRAMHRAIKKVSSDLENLSFNTAIATLMETVNELYKLKLQIPYTQAPATWKWTAETFAQLLAPFAPHIAEELWQQLGRNESIHTSTWPEHDESFLTESTMAIVVQINGKVRAQISVAADATKDQIIKAAQNNEKIITSLDGREVKKTIYVPGKLVSLVA
ncbi:MAG TPA: leucine--tRNA ligase [Candidatus Saccharimonadales bacterium]|nr:leucine--tRNA ligase [Candidatus Saccharimonadales bacterium]